MKKNLILYHANCADGMAAMWCFWSYYGEHAEYVPMRYGDAVPETKGRHVYLVDYSLPPAQMELLAEDAASVVLLDHHASVEQYLPRYKSLGIDTSHFTKEHSGCIIAWQYINGTHPPPALLLHIEDRDLWRFALPDTRAVSAYLFSIPLDIVEWDKAITSGEASIATGRILDTQHLKNANIIAKQCSRIVKVENEDWTFVNCPGIYSSDVGNIVSATAPFAVTYTDTEESRLFSLRSNRNFNGWADVSVIAEKYGGGGHANAAGFKVSRDHFLAKL